MNDLCKTLRDAADNIEASALKPGTAKPDIPLSQAAEQLIGAGLKTISIKCELGFRAYSDSRWEVEWSVYDGKKFHEASTLSGAVQMAIAANQPPVRAELPAVESALAG